MKNLIKLLNYDARNGDLDIMQKILNFESNILSLSTVEDAFINACKNGHLIIVQ